MYDANNMYIQGKPSERKWLTPMGRMKQKLAGLVMPNCNQFPQKGERFELPIHHRAFKPDLAAKNLKPVDFSQLRDASDHEILSAVKWIEEKVGWFHSIDLRNSIKTPGHRGWASRKKIFSIPEAVQGKTILDIGAMEGGDSFCAEEAGATVIQTGLCRHHRRLLTW